MKKQDNVIEVDSKENVSCPIKKHENWNLHPRVYINFRKNIGNCPYCGTIFKIK